MKNIIKSKRLISYVMVLILGLITGWILFGSNTKESKSNEQTELVENDIKWWTCSMHPQIKQPEFGDCPICGMDLIPLVAGQDDNNPGIVRMNKSAMKLANIQQAEVKKSIPEKEIFLQGRIVSDERRISSQVVHYNGRIDKLYVKFVGEKIVKGQKLARIFSPQLITAQQELLEAIKQGERFSELAKLAKDKLLLMKLNEEQIANIINNGKTSSYFDILADQSGFVTKKYLNTGDYVKIGNVLFEITDMSFLWVVFDIYENDLPFIQIGDLISYSANGNPSTLYKSKITFIDPSVDKKNRTVKARIEVNNQNLKLKPEMFVSGLLSSKMNKESIIIPKSAVMWTGKRSVVYVKVPDMSEPVFEFREVLLGEDLGDKYIINKGLKEGEYVVVNGAFTIDAAAQLNNKFSMMNLPERNPVNDIIEFDLDLTSILKDQLRTVLKHYIQLKDVLIETDHNQAIKMNLLLIEAINGINNLPIGDEGDYIKGKIDILKEEVQKMANAKDILDFRRSFKLLSSAFIPLINNFNISSDKIYIDYCPMFDNDKGGYWLSMDSIISNPYFGDEMMRCGEIEDIINK
ncbi:efflux RND transporter periplasmic adaptor subunit [Bacteroidota bacterium]